MPDDVTNNGSAQATLFQNFQLKLKTEFNNFKQTI